MKISAYIGLCMMDGVPDFAQMGDKKVLALCIVQRPTIDPIFKDIDRALVALVGGLEDAIKTVWIQRPIKIAFAFVGIVWIVHQ